MPESKPSYTSALTSLRETLGRDGHLTENVVAIISHQAAQVRRLYPALPDAILSMADAFAGKNNRIPREIVDRMTTLSLILNNSTLASDAQNAGMMCSPNQAKELDDTFHKEGIAGLREVALKLTLPAKPRAQSVSLSDRIKASPQI